eukprot:CAMPEP_0184688216 /NCGR_PEP_ID=MMETSP0312-20130426/28982_1 /TAXON_ID=31354 /ORGANISM="Compsopogon coeruleus, Strain SAG 36.94" /LENGTH=146 /DNA_ID=CAMNT_0027145103 /DNA_START=182 /DNA_END=622 /DNA_ORIENTATION=+
MTDGNQVRWQPHVYERKDDHSQSPSCEEHFGQQVGGECKQRGSDRFGEADEASSFVRIRQDNRRFGELGGKTKRTNGIRSRRYKSRQRRRSNGEEHDTNGYLQWLSTRINEVEQENCGLASLNQVLTSMAQAIQENGKRPCVFPAS